MISLHEEVNVNVLLGKTLRGVDSFNSELVFHTTDGESYLMWHKQDCCESVTIEDVCGSIDDLIGVPLLMAEESTNSENPPEDRYIECFTCFTWTFYRFATIKGNVTIRWYGASNGYYSESVSFERVK